MSTSGSSLTWVRFFARASTQTTFKKLSKKNSRRTPRTTSHCSCLRRTRGRLLRWRPTTPATDSRISRRHTISLTSPSCSERSSSWPMFGAPTSTSSSIRLSSKNLSLNSDTPASKTELPTIYCDYISRGSYPFILSLIVLQQMGFWGFGVLGRSEERL